MRGVHAKIGLLEVAPQPPQARPRPGLPRLPARNPLPGDWATAEARSLLGEALAGQGEFSAAEPLLLDAQKALTERRDKIPPLDRDVTFRDAAERLVRLYEAWGKPEKAEEWRKRLGEHPLDRGFPADPFAR